jgi:predicted MFS family arabinose efflux permease
MASSSTAFAPLKEPLFRRIWGSSFFSNIGAWMYNVGVSWLSTTMSASALMIALIQTASSLPSFLFSYLAGVTSDRLDRRKLIIGIQLTQFVIVVALIILTWQNKLNMNLLLLFTFLIGTCTAFVTPVWDSIMPEVVSPENLKPAIALEGVNFNLARAIGPALGGFLLTIKGILSVFIFNAFSALAPVFGVYAWKNTAPPAPSISFRQSATEGWQAIKKSKSFLLLLVRTLSFTACLSTLFALLPQISKYEWKQTSSQFTFLWVSLGLGATLGSWILSLLTKSVKPSRVIYYSSLLVAVCLFLLTRTTHTFLIYGILFLAGIGWICAIATINVLAQQLSPAPYKGRFLSINTTVFQGSIALSSAGWGWLAGELTSLKVFGMASLSMVLVSSLIMFLLPMPADADTNTPAPATVPVPQDTPVKKT